MDSTDLTEMLSDIFCTNDPDILAELSAEARTETFDKGVCVVPANERLTKIRFLISGILRTYLVDLNGKDITDCFLSVPGMPVVPTANLDPSPISIETLTPCELLTLSADTVERILLTTLDGAHAYNRMLQEAWQVHRKTKMAFEQYKAAERYTWFKETFPEVDRQVPARHVASFLGMTPVTLSRIKTSQRHTE